MMDCAGKDVMLIRLDWIKAQTCCALVQVFIRVPGLTLLFQKSSDHTGAAWHTSTLRKGSSLITFASHVCCRTLSSSSVCLMASIDATDCQMSRHNAVSVFCAAVFSCHKSIPIIKDTSIETVDTLHFVLSFFKPQRFILNLGKLGEITQ